MTEKETLQILIITCIYSLLWKVWKGFSIRPERNSVENISPNKINKDWLITYYHVLQLGFWKMCMSLPFLLLHTLVKCLGNFTNSPNITTTKWSNYMKCLYTTFLPFLTWRRQIFFPYYFQIKKITKTILMKLSVVFYITIKRH